MSRSEIPTKRACLHLLKDGGAINAGGVRGFAKFSCQVLDAVDFMFEFRVDKRSEIDYRGTQSTPVKNQGAFGTCWSFGFAASFDPDQSGD